MSHEAPDGIAYNTVWTPGQWIEAWETKQDWSPILDEVISSGGLSGLLFNTDDFVIAASTVSLAPTISTAHTFSAAIAFSAAVSSTASGIALSFSGTGAIKLPVGTTAERPDTGNVGEVRYNTTSSRHEFGAGGSWKNHVRLDGDTMTGALGISAGTGVTFSSSGEIRGGSASTNYVRLVGGATNATVIAASGDLIVNPSSASGFVTTTVAFKSPSYVSPGNTQELTGSTPIIPTLSAVTNLASTAGASTLSAEQTIATIGSSSDTLNAPSASLYTLKLLDHLGAAWQGSRVGLYAEMQANANNTLTGAGAINGLHARMSSGFSMTNGVGTGFGVSTFGAGGMWGLITESILTTGATYWNSSIGYEVDISNGTGTSVIASVGIQIAHYGTHRVKGTLQDTAFLIADQVGATVGWTELISAGANAYDCPLDPVNGYVLRAKMPSDPAEGIAAGGIDLLQLSFSGAGTGAGLGDLAGTGGGFAFRSIGFQVLNSGGIQTGYALLSKVATGLSIDTVYQEMTAAAVAVGGIDFTSGDLLADANGNVIQVSGLSGTVITAVTIVRGGFMPTGSLPVNPVTFTAITHRGTGFGTGATFNLTYTPQTNMELQPSGGTLQSGSGTWTANGSIATAMSSVGPTGSHTTVQEWFTVKNAGGTVRYIPAF